MCKQANSQSSMRFIIKRRCCCIDAADEPGLHDVVNLLNIEPKKPDWQTDACLCLNPIQRDRGGPDDGRTLQLVGWGGDSKC